MSDKTFVDKFFDKLGDIMKPSEKNIKQILSRNEKMENISQKVSAKAETIKDKLSKFELQRTTYYFLFFFVLALISRALA
jgi:hypothetical protein